MTTETRDKIEAALDSVRPFLKLDGGNVELVEVDKNNVVTLKLLGACRGCEMSHMTMKAGIEEGIKKAVPQIESVIAIN